MSKIPWGDTNFKPKCWADDIWEWSKIGNIRGVPQDVKAQEVKTLNLPKDFRDFFDNFDICFDNLVVKRMSK